MSYVRCSKNLASSTKAEGRERRKGQINYNCLKTQKTLSLSWIPGLEGSKDVP